MNVLRTTLLSIATLCMTTQYGHSEEHRVYGKKLLVVKNCSSRTLKFSTAQPSGGEQAGRASRSVAQFKTFETSDTPVEELHVELDGEEKNFQNLESGDHTSHVMRHPESENWKFILGKGISC